MGDGFEKWQPEALGNGGGDEVAGVPDPGLEAARCPGGGDQASGDAELDGQALSCREFPPMVVDGEGFGIVRRATDGEPGVRRGEGGEEDEFAQVFPANATDGGEEDGRGGRGVYRGGDGNGVGEKLGVFRGESGVGEDLEIAGIEEGVADAWGKWIEGPAIGDERIVPRPAGFREVVDLQDETLTIGGKAGDDFRDEDVFAEGVVVKVPDIGRAAEGFGGGGAEIC